MDSSTSRKKIIAHIQESTALHRTLHHPIILSLYAVFSTPAATYQVLELCTRGSLSDYIQSRHDRRLTEPQTRAVIRTLVDALTYLRKELVLHRDIKAGNVLISDDSRVVCLSFSFSVVLD
jgi:polo-like kinase 4